MAIIKDATNEQFKKLIEDGETFVANFFATWCGPCQMYGPIYEQVGEEQDIKLLKIDVDKEGALASEVGVMGVPTTIMYKQGKPVDRFSGLAPKDQLLDFINKNK